MGLKGLVRVLAGSRFRLKWFTCRDCNRWVIYKVWAEFREQLRPQRLTILGSPNHL